MSGARPLSWLAPHLSFASLFSVISDWVSELSAVGGSAGSSGTSLSVWVMATEGVHTDAECLAGAADVYPQSRCPNAYKQGCGGAPPEVPSPAPSTELG